MDQLRHGSLFSGIGGFDLAAQWAGWTNVFQVEKDKSCSNILKNHFPDVKRYTEIREFSGKEWAGRVDVISGGFPCQPFSQAGKRKGKADDRFLWPEMLRIIREADPPFVVGENVAGLLSMEDGRTLDLILTDLANEGYSVESFVIPACSLGAWHRRDRIWIIGHKLLSDTERSNQRPAGDSHTAGEGRGSAVQEEDKGRESQTVLNTGLVSLPGDKGQDAPNTVSYPSGSSYGKGERISSRRRQKPDQREWSEMGSYITDGSRYWSVEPRVGRMAHGVPNRVDRLKSLGNAIVPQVAYEIFKAIDELYKSQK